MQFQVLKAVKNADSQFHVVLASIDRNSEGKYKGILMIADKKKPRSRYEASDIHIVGRNKQIVYEQMQKIAELYPPMKNDVHILDIEESLEMERIMKKQYEK